MLWVIKISALNSNSLPDRAKLPWLPLRQLSQNMHLFSAPPLSDSFFTFQSLMDLSIQEKNTLSCTMRDHLSKGFLTVCLFVCVCVCVRAHAGCQCIQHKWAWRGFKRSIPMNLCSSPMQQNFNTVSIAQRVQASQSGQMKAGGGERSTGRERGR